MRKEGPEDGAGNPGARVQQHAQDDRAAAAGERKFLLRDHVQEM